MNAGAVLGWLALAALAPGAAHLRAGWRKTGLALISCYAALLLAVLAVGLTNDLGNLAGSLTDDSWLLAIVIGGIVLGLAWFALIVHSFVVLRPGRLTQTGQILTGTVAGLLAVIVVLPFALTAQFAQTSRQAIQDIFQAPENEGQPPSPSPSPRTRGPGASASTSCCSAATPTTTGPACVPTA
ncbi:hypothetical protein ACFQYP_07265 [Nonomuraea antimicrobica]